MVSAYPRLFLTTALLSLLVVKGSHAFLESIASVRVSVPRRSTFRTQTQVTHPTRRKRFFAETVLEQHDDCPPGYYLDRVQARCNRLGPLGRASQVVETFGPLKKVSSAISTLFGIDESRIGSLGVAFALSYSIISNINGSISLSVAWYMCCSRTGLSPLASGQWKELLKSYGTIYALIQLLRPFRVAAAIGMSKLSNEFLEQTQEKLDCSRGIAILFQYALGWVAWLSCATVGISVASWLSGVPVWANN